MPANVTRSLGRIGLGAGVMACTATIAYDLVQILQILGVLRFPVDEILIFGTSLCIVVPFVLEVLAFHYSRPTDKQFWSHAALLFAMMYAVFGTANYVVQLTTVIPARLHGATEAIRVLEQTPHSLLWDFDAVAYIAMGITALLAFQALRADGIERWARISCLAHAAATVLAGVVYFSPNYSERLLLLGFPWGITAPLFMFLLGLATLAPRSQRQAEREGRAFSEHASHGDVSTHRASKLSADRQAESSALHRSRQVRVLLYERLEDALQHLRSDPTARVSDLDR